VDKKPPFNDLGKMDVILNGIVQDLMKERGTPYNQALRKVRHLYPQIIQLREALYQKEQDSVHDVKHYHLINGQLKEADDQIERLTQTAIQAHPGLDYSQALRIVASDNPELFRRREELFSSRH